MLSDKDREVIEIAAKEVAQAMARELIRKVLVETALRKHHDGVHLPCLICGEGEQ